ncbi:hypothetical protein [Streptomyces sp. WMMB303]|uniref:hypothetical protein n=1 Tax=Streptomyces sp. WMMB303 TaxID=3034154 RepID=UPI0023ECE568|nr:hypothetical protein [Streptomyces sp. WMMB303]MDF4250435.1 hypothetical protein [Streptomyces sp. WMMB303]
MQADTKRAIRTVLQTAVALAVLLPAVVEASGIPESLPWVAGALTVAGGLARVMALPGVQRLLPEWLRTGGDTDGDLAGPALRARGE